MEQKWSFPGLFDVIHGRLLFTIQLDFPKLFAQAYANLAPGGCFEVQEYLWPLYHDGDIDPTSCGAAWADGFGRGLATLGLDWQKSSKFDTYMKEQGFVDVQVNTFRVPYGEWPKDPKEKQAGRIMERDCLPRSFPWWNVILSKGVGWSEDKINNIQKELTAEIRSQKARFWLEYRVISGKKPE